MTDYISREAAIEALEGCQQYKVSTEDYAVDYTQAKTELMMLPSADVRENVRGEWKRTVTGHQYCSSCNWFPEENEMTGFFYDFCPNCGADMRGEE